MWWSVAMLQANLSFEIKKQIASIFESNSDHICIYLETTQQQENNTDFGLNAIT